MCRLRCFTRFSPIVWTSAFFSYFIQIRACFFFSFFFRMLYFIPFSGRTGLIIGLCKLARKKISVSASMFADQTGYSNDVVWTVCPRENRLVRCPLCPLGRTDEIAALKMYKRMKMRMENNKTKACGWILLCFFLVLFGCLVCAALAGHNIFAQRDRNFDVDFIQAPLQEQSHEMDTKRNDQHKKKQKRELKPNPEIDKDLRVEFRFKSTTRNTKNGRTAATKKIK